MNKLNIRTAEIKAAFPTAELVACIDRRGVHTGDKWQADLGDGFRVVIFEGADRTRFEVHVERPADSTAVAQNCGLGNLEVHVARLVKGFGKTIAELMAM